MKTILSVVTLVVVLGIGLGAWVYTPESRAFFFSRVLADDVPLLQPVFEQVVNSAIVP
jgi:hypothetical protein